MLLFVFVSRGEKQECKFFDQMVQLFGNKYVINSDPVADDAADVMGKKSHCLPVVRKVSNMLAPCTLSTDLIHYYCFFYALKKKERFTN